MVRLIASANSSMCFRVVEDMPAAKILTSTFPVRGSTADCFKASRCNLQQRKIATFVARGVQKHTCMLPPRPAPPHIAKSESWRALRPNELSFPTGVGKRSLVLCRCQPEMRSGMYYSIAISQTSATYLSHLHVFLHQILPSLLGQLRIDMHLRVSDVVANQSHVLQMKEALCHIPEDLTNPRFTKCSPSSSSGLL